MRLYNKHELNLAFNRDSNYYDKVREQYEYAKENLESMKRAVSAEGAS